MANFSSDVRVRYSEGDPMGFAHHSNYFKWFEMCRIEFLDKLQYPYSKMEAEGYIVPVVEARARFSKPAHFDDKLQIKASLQIDSKICFHLNYEVYRASEKIATGYTSHVFVKNGRTVRLPEFFVSRLKEA